MRKTILLVHSDDEILWAMRGLLLADGYAVAWARDADEARQVVDDGVTPDVVLVDEESVGEGGLERLRGVAVAAPRVLLTWKPRSMHPHGVITIGKPFRARDLREAIADVVVPAVRPMR